MPLSTFLDGRPAIQLRGLQWLALSDLATVQTRQINSDLGGGGTSVWQTGTTVACRIWPVTIRGKGRVIGGALSEYSTHFLATPLGTKIGLDDRVVIVGRGTFEITMALDRTAPLTSMYEAFQTT
jgi:hypothetical protein